METIRFFMFSKFFIGILVLIAAGIVIDEQKQIAGTVLLGIFFGLGFGMSLTSLNFICNKEKAAGDEVQSDNTAKHYWSLLVVKLIIFVILLICAELFIYSGKSNTIVLIGWGIFASSFTITVDSLVNILFQNYILDKDPVFA